MPPFIKAFVFDTLLMPFPILFTLTIIRSKNMPGRYMAILDGKPLKLLKVQKGSHLGYLTKCKRYCAG